MVNVTIFVEGGVLCENNAAAATFDNSEKLRKGFYKIISQIIDDEYVNINVAVGAGYINTAKMFKNSYSSKTLLLIDLDAEKSEKKRRLQELSLEEYADDVFFMVQAMEAWFISQPEKIKNVMKKYFRAEPKAGFEDDEYFQKHPETITHPDRAMETILGRYFIVGKNGKWLKKKYGKLKDAHFFLSELDAEKLTIDFEDMRNLSARLR